jgi:hypothetical protein
MLKQHRNPQHHRSHISLGQGLRDWHAGPLAALVLATALLLVGLSLGARAWVHQAQAGGAHLAALMAWKLFDLSTEQNVPTWFSSSLLLICALLAATLALLRKVAGHRYAWHWLGLAVALALLSLDETVALHEHLQGPATRALGDSAGGLLHFAWVVPGTLVAAVLGLGLVAFVSHLEARVRRLLVVACTLFAAGALGFEMLGGAVLERYGDRVLYALVTTAEETLELSGAVLVLYALMTCLRVERAADGSLWLGLSEAARGRAGASPEVSPLPAQDGDLSAAEISDRSA